jgi:hypothetical protein
LSVNNQHNAGTIEILINAQVAVLKTASLIPTVGDIFWRISSVLDN